MRVHVATGRPYDVTIERGAVDRLAEILPQRFARVAIVADRAVTRIAERAAASLRAGGTAVHLHVVTAGEPLKTFAALEPLYERLGDAGIDRAGAIVGVGGGTIGDAIGFLAATYLRGVPFINIPTTLLAAVDSAIGGKTGINLRSGKNLVGLVAQPLAVVTDLDAFDSLDPRDVASGFAEIVKIALVADPAFADRLSASRTIDAATIGRAVALKAAIVERDEEDRTGEREVLNFGHTLGHALEAVTDFTRFRHGEAVAWGMRGALRLSRRRGHLRDDAFAIADRLVATLAPPPLPFVDDDAIVAATRRDKKRADGQTRYVLLRDIGASVIDRNVEETDVRAVLHELRSP